MPKTLIRYRISLYFLTIISIIILLFSIVTIKIFKNYSEKNHSDYFLVQAEYIADILHSISPKIGNPDILSSLVFNIAEGKDFLVEIIDPAGTIIATSQPQSQRYNQKDMPEVIKAFSGQNGITTRKSFNRDNKEALFIAVPFGNQIPYQAVVRISTLTEPVDQEFYDLIKTMFLVFLITFILAGIISIKATQRIFQPLEQIIQTADLISQGNLEKRVHYRGNTNEFLLLAHTLNNLTNNLATKIKEISIENQKLELLLENMDNIVLSIDKMGKVFAINAVGRSFFAQQTPFVVGKHNLELIGNSNLDKAVKTCISTGQSSTINLKLTILEQTYVFQVFITPTPNIRTNFIDSALCVFHDITALQIVQEKQAKFIANASHELATPLTSIKGFAETLMDGALKSPELSEKFVKIIYEESERMQRLITDLLQITRLNSDEYKKTLTSTSFCPKELLQSVADELTPQANNKNITINIAYLKTSGKIHTNKDWLKQALVNILENAIKYSPENSLVNMIYTETQQETIFAVSDQGIGISQADLPFVFDRFYQASRDRNKIDASGTGLGLSIVKFIVELLGGKVTVESRVNIGTTFTITIPLKNEFS